MIDLGRDPETGRRRQKWHSGYRTKREAEAAVSELIGAVNRGTYVAKTRQTLAAFAEEWLAAIAPTVRPATHYSYARNLRLHVLPYLGAATLVAIDAGSLNRLYARLLADGRRNTKGGGLSPRSVRYVHTILHRVLKDAVKLGRLARNPADAADPPRSPSPSPAMVTWTAQELREFLAATTNDRLHAAWVLLATTGMRRGEALGLRWSDVDLNAARAAVRQTVIAVRHEVAFGTPKTAKGRRTVALDAGTVTALREHRKRQNAERLQVGAGRHDHDLVFCGIDGTPLHPERFSRSFSDRIRQLGLPKIRLHDLRHGWATTALAAGVHPKVVQERLGHANISITLDVYSHVAEGLHVDAAEKVAGLFSG
ncbi:MAG: tyrosine-type recombinase/integrase, partial [Mycobacterium leprae]